MKKLTLEVSDAWAPGKCIDFPLTPRCPFAERGCWVRDPNNCPLKKTYEESVNGTGKPKTE